MLYWVAADNSAVELSKGKTKFRIPVGDYVCVSTVPDTFWRVHEIQKTQSGHALLLQRMPGGDFKLYALSVIVPLSPLEQLAAQAK